MARQASTPRTALVACALLLMAQGPLGAAADRALQQVRLAGHGDTVLPSAAIGCCERDRSRRSCCSPGPACPLCSVIHLARPSNHRCLPTLTVAGAIGRGAAAGRARAARRIRRRPGARALARHQHRIGGAAADGRWLDDRQHQRAGRAVRGGGHGPERHAPLRRLFLPDCHSVARGDGHPLCRLGGAVPAGPGCSVQLAAADAADAHH